MQKIYGIHTVITLLQTNPKLITKLYLQESREDQRFQTIRQQADQSHILIKQLTRQDLEAMLPKDICFQGIIAEVAALPEYHERDLSKFLNIDNLLLLVLDGVQDPHNLGACLRSANAFGVHAVIAPKDRSVGLTPTVRKVACGAAELTPFITVTNLARVLKHLQEQGIWLVGTGDEAITPISEIDLVGRIALVMGGEGKGLRRLTKQHCDYFAKIPMQGNVDSFNVSVATGICLYEANRQRAGKFTS